MRAKMIENWVSMTAFPGFCLIALFHAGILLIAPGRYIPTYNWNRQNLTLVRKTTVEFGKRLAGLLLSAMIVWIFIRPVVKWMLHPVGRKTTSGESPLPPGIARWDMLGSALFCIGCSYFLLTRPERSLELMFTAERSRLQDKTKLRLWTLEVQMAAVLMLICSLLPTVDFVRSLRH
jgi:hypothetical protein